MEGKEEDKQGVITINGIKFTYHVFSDATQGRSCSELKLEDVQEGLWEAYVPGRDAAEAALAFWRDTVGSPDDVRFVDHSNITDYGKMGRDAYRTPIKVCAGRETMGRMYMQIHDRAEAVASKGSFDPEYPGTIILGLTEKVEIDYYEKVIAPSLGGWKKMEADATAAAGAAADAADAADAAAAAAAILFNEEMRVETKSGIGGMARGHTMADRRVTIKKESNGWYLMIEGLLETPFRQINKIDKDRRMTSQGESDFAIFYGDKMQVVIRPDTRVKEGVAQGHTKLSDFIAAVINTGSHNIEIAPDVLAAAGVLPTGGAAAATAFPTGGAMGGGKRRKTKRRKSTRKRKSTKKRRTKKRRTKKRRSRR
jgi:hypothetical protein